MHYSRLPRIAALLGLLLGLATLFAAPDAAAQDGCPPGYRLNRWGRCVPMRGPPAQCPPGYVYDQSGQCVAAQPQQQACPPGTVVDAYGRCMPVQGRPMACPIGTESNGYGQCVPVRVRSACTTCVQGAQEICNGCDDNCNGVVDENCISAAPPPPPPPPQGCPPGTAMDAYGRCVGVQQQQPQACPPGYFYWRGNCVQR